MKNGSKRTLTEEAEEKPKSYSTCDKATIITVAILFLSVICCLSISMIIYAAVIGSKETSSMTTTQTGSMVHKCNNITLSEGRYVIISDHKTAPIRAIVSWNRVEKMVFFTLNSFVFPLDEECTPIHFNGNPIQHEHQPSLIGKHHLSFPSYFASGEIATELKISMSNDGKSSFSYIPICSNAQKSPQTTSNVYFSWPILN